MTESSRRRRSEPSGKHQAASDGDKSRGRAAIWAWLVGLAALAAVVGAVLSLSEIEEMGRLLDRMRPRWLLLAFALQSATYLCAAGVWHVALLRAGYRFSTLSLVPTSLAMLFTNQAMPTGGLSGSAVVLRALRLRGVQENAAMAALLVGLLTTYAAYLLAIAVSAAVLAARHLLNTVLLIVIALFVLAAVAIPLALVWYTKSAASPRVHDRLARVPALGPVLTALASAPREVLRDPRVLGWTIALQFIELVLDASTLYVMIVALGVDAAFPAVFASFVMAYVAAHVGPTPLGLGTFEGTSIAMLHLIGIGIEAALGATILFRAYTLWLPMLPGFWCMRLLVPRGSS